MRDQVLPAVVELLAQAAPHLGELREQSSLRSKTKRAGARALVVHRGRKEVLSKAHLESALVVRLEAAAKAEQELEAAEHVVRQAEAGAERDAWALQALERTSLNVPARLLRETRKLEESEREVWDAHRQIVAALAMAKQDARVRAQQTATAVAAAEEIQRAAIQTTVLAERKSDKDNVLREEAEAFLHAAMYTEERRLAEEHERASREAAESSSAAYEFLKHDVGDKIRKQDEIEMSMVSCACSFQHSGGAANAAQQTERPNTRPRWSAT